jgi:hypothetical protein
MTGLFTDDSGNLSSTRVFTAAIIAVVLFNWTYATVRTGSWQPLDLDAALALAGALAAKVCQKFAENGGSASDRGPAREG